MSNANWSSSLSHSMKRQLSTLEKISFTCPAKGRALLLPAVPDNEAEELHEYSGYPFSRMVLVEQDPELAKALFLYYYDSVLLVNADIDDFLELSVGDPFSYAHLDYCGFFNFAHLKALQTLVQKLTKDISVHVRVSVFKSRKDGVQLEAERGMRKQYITEPILHLMSLDADKDKWSRLLDDLSEDDADTTQLILSALFCESFFKKLVASANLDGSFYIPSNINRFAYQEAGSSNLMHTCWLKLSPAVLSVNKATEDFVNQYLLIYAYDFYQTLNSKLPLANDLIHTS